MVNDNLIIFVFAIGAALFTLFFQRIQKRNDSTSRRRLVNVFAVILTVLAVGVITYSLTRPR